ncbi:MAG TPA: cellulase family glycosylhydrolase, partial [Opitutus sp.]|nr:cellulase family glycosylhydrolase [Opitutus sp.]
AGVARKQSVMYTPINRRDFVKGASIAAAAAMLDLPRARAAALPQPTAAKLPRWRGFNLLEKFIAAQGNAAFREEDFAWMAEWGFNFVRLPMSYYCWSDPHNWREIREPVMKEIDAALEFGRRYGVHVCMNFHRAPGYSVDRSVKEPFNLWTDAEALEACVYHWSHFAARYKDVPNSALSFDLLNEPAMVEEGRYVDDATYFRVAQALVEGIRAESPDRLVIADGLVWGNLPVPALASLGIAQSTRGYQPMQVSHWKASWVAPAERWPRPTWPLPVGEEAAKYDRAQAVRFKEVFSQNPIVGKMADDPVLQADWNRERIEHQLIRPWQALEAMGVGVHVGEWGAHHFTPHDVTLAWMKDMLAAWKDAGWGWALWNFRGTFGVLDSGRTDVAYEDFHGHKLDRAMLEVLRAG